MRLDADPTQKALLLAGCRVRKTGKHVYCEAPSCVFVCDARKAIHLTQTTHLVLHPGMLLFSRGLPSTIILEAEEEVDEAVYIKQAVHEVGPNLF